MGLEIVFLGSTGFSVDILEGLLASGHDVTKIIALSDRPAGRGRKLRATPVKIAASGCPGITLVEYEEYTAGSAESGSAGREKGLGVVAAFGKIVPRSFIDRFPLGIINVHPSLLPKFRGAAPVHRAIMEGHAVTGVSLACLDEGIDTGDLIDQRELRIEDDDDFLSLEKRLAGLAVEMLKENLDRLDREGNLERTPQDGSEATYAHPIARDECRIEWERPGAHVFNQIRGLSPRPGAFTFFRGKRLKILGSRQTGVTGGGNPGTIEAGGKEDILVHTGSGSLLLTALQPEGSRVLTAGEFMRGYRIAEGDTFSDG